MLFAIETIVTPTVLLFLAVIFFFVPFVDRRNDV
jgi:hypothetical protein